MLTRTFFRMMARTLVAGPAADAEALAARCAGLLGRRWKWIPALTRRYVEAFGEGARPATRQVVRLLSEHLSDHHIARIQVANWVSMDAPQMRPVSAASAWDIPAIESTAALCAWLGVTQGELAWFADLRGLTRRAPDARAAHYHYRVLAKDSGSLRLIEIPKPRLKELQQSIMRGMLDRIPPHAASHGFVKGRSIQSFAAPHVGQPTVLRMDLRDFFPSLAGVRVQAIFRTMGYPEAVADLLGGICTNSAPLGIWKQAAADPAVAWHTSRLHARPHLPQGAPTSPALANLCFYRADCRLSAFVSAAGATYTRYADDLAFSGGDLTRHPDDFAAHAAAILIEEGFAVNHRKTRIMRRSGRQRICGLVTNEHLNIARDDFDQLKALLTNCVRSGPQSQNRAGQTAFREHLQGRVAFVESVNANKGRRLRALFDRIEWA